MTVTLDMLRALLERALTHTDNSAILRLPESARTVEGLMIAYLGEEAWTIMEWADVDDVRATISAMAWRSRSVPFRSRALLVALTLAMGLDPGVGGLDVCWARLTPNGWTVQQFARGVTFNDHWRAPGGVMQHKCAPLVAAEPDPVRALALAVAHVVGTP